MTNETIDEQIEKLISSFSTPMKMQSDAGMVDHGTSSDRIALLNALLAYKQANAQTDTPIKVTKISWDV